jgi:hypothetical protein
VAGSTRIDATGSLHKSLQLRIGLSASRLQTPHLIAVNVTPSYNKCSRFLEGGLVAAGRSEFTI